MGVDIVISWCVDILFKVFYLSLNWFVIEIR